MLKNKIIFLYITFICSIAIAQTTFFKKLDVDFINLDNSTISTTGSNTNLTLDPTGTGKIVLNATVNNSALTANRVVVSDANKDLTSSSVTDTELGYLSGVTSALQTQLDALGGGSGVGGVNYIDNFDAEDDTSGWVMYDDSIGASSVSGLVDEATDTISIANSFQEGDIVYYVGDSAIGNLTEDANWVVRNPTSTTFQLATSYGGTPRDLTSDGTGSQYFRPLKPINGTGGSPTSTWTRVTGGALRDSASFLYNRPTPGANVGDGAGAGVAYDFSIDTADISKPLSISFDYGVSSGTYTQFSVGSLKTFTDMMVYIYDKVNNVLVEPASTFIEPVSGTTGKYYGTFQANAGSSSYRLIIHGAKYTDQNTFSMLFDNILVGPSVTAQGPPATDWQSYTPTFTGFGTAANVSFQWRREGSDLLIRGQFASGTPTGVTAEVSLPSGLTSASTLGANNVAGVWFRGASATEHGGAVLIGPSVTSLKFGAVGTFSNSSANAASNALGNAIILAGETIVINPVRIPIAGWSSNVQMSSDTDTRVTAFSGYVISHALTADTTLVVLTADKDTHGGWSSNTYTVKVPGDYFIGASVLSSSGAGNIYVVKNGSKHKYLSSCNTVYYSGGSVYMPSLVAGDTISFKSDTNITISGTTVGSGVTSTFHITRVSGPSQIAATEKVQAVYKIASGVSSSTSAPIDFATKVTDTHSAVTTGASWKFIAPSAGTYLVTTSFATTAATAGVKIYKNGSDAGLQLFDANSTYTLGGSAQIDLIAGDYIDLRTAGAATLNNNSSYNVSISRIK